jgi:hypothetical protein
MDLQVDTISEEYNVSETLVIYVPTIPHGINLEDQQWHTHFL